MAGGWPSRIVGRLVGLRGGTARQSRLRGSVLGSAASRCVDFPSLPHSHTAFSVVPTFSSFARPLDSRHFTFVTRFLIYFFYTRLTFRSCSRCLSASFSSLASVLFSDYFRVLFRLGRVSFLRLYITRIARSVSLLCPFSFADRKRAPQGAQCDAS